MSETLYELRLAANDRVYSSITEETLRRWIVERRLLGHDLVKVGANGSWRPIAELPELAVLLPTTSPAAPSPSRPAPTPAKPRAAAASPTRPSAASNRPLPAPISNDLGIPEPTHRRPRRGRRRLEDSVMDMTPMIDVTFQLLIFFMFTNQMAQQSPIDAPEALYGKGVLPDGKQALLVDDQGRYYLGENTNPDNIAPSLDALIGEVQKNVDASPEPMEVIITAHKNAKHLHVRQLVERLEKLDGIGPIHLGVEEKR